MKVAFPNFSRSNILIIGDVMLDRYCYGSTKRISSEAPVSIVNVGTIEDRPGGAANVAMNVSALGAKAKLIGLVGVDEAANILKNRLRLFNVDYDFLTTTSHPTIVKLRVLSHNQQLIRLDFEKYFENIDIKYFIKRVKSALFYADILVISDYAKGLLNHCVEDVIAIARQLSVPIIVDPKGGNFIRYTGATIITPNLSEFEIVSKSCNNSEDILIERGMNIIDQCQLSAILITRSEQGMTLLQRGKGPLHFSTEAKEVYDVTGAGDTVVGVLAAGLSVGVNLEEACFFANISAGIVVGKLGTSVISFVELQNILNNRSDVMFGILNEEMLKKYINIVRKRGEKIVMTNGVFDILHVGHVTYLARAKKLGDRLIVAVNSDSSVKRLKGKSRPINTLKKRMLVLSALEAVDWVVPLYEDSPKRLILSLLPDFLVKGGDYYSHDIIGRQEVLSYGGQVHILSSGWDCSTSNIIDICEKFKQ